MFLRFCVFLGSGFCGQKIMETEVILIGVVTGSGLGFGVSPLSTENT